ncbi:unnamed protein product [Parajaminaea phylloscopi]
MLAVQKMRNTERSRSELCPRSDTFTCTPSTCISLVCDPTQLLHMAAMEAGPARGVALQTSLGLITVELYWSHAPKTCENFWQLSHRGYYNGVPFHRIVPDFMIQGGDPTATGRGGASIYGDKFADEIDPRLRFTGAGILAMANSGPNTNGSQFFVTLAPTPHLDRKHTIFGRVVEGMSIVQRMGLVATDADDRPTEDIKILRATTTEG